MIDYFWKHFDVNKDADNDDDESQFLSRNSSYLFNKNAIASQKLLFTPPGVLGLSHHSPPPPGLVVR